MSSTNQAPTHGSRFLVVRGAHTALRLALPGFGSLVIGSDPACDVHIDESGLAPRAAELFLDFDVGLQALQAGAERLAFDPAGAPSPEPLAERRTVDLGPGDRVRLGSVELSFAPAIVEPTSHHVWSRAYLETRLQELLWQDSPVSFSVLRVRAAGLGPEKAEQLIKAELNAGDVIGEFGKDEHAAILMGTHARGRAVARALSRALQAHSDAVRIGLIGAEADSEAAGLIEQATLRMEATDSDSAGRTYTPIAPCMEPVMRLVEQVSRTSAPVLILGETGTGKDVFAQLVHEGSDRATGPLVRVNCVDLPETFLDDASTNFLTDAAGGTAVLDQVEGLTERAQVTLGYLLEESRLRTHDVRFIATSNQDLARAVEQGSFRKDLYFRLNRVTLAVPPLRDRTQDILPLAEHFIADVCTQTGRSRPALTRAAAAQLEGYSWPGNLRELRNMLERAVLTVSGDTLGVEQLPVEISGQVPLPANPRKATEPGGARPSNLREEIAALEKRRILEALEEYATQTEAAKALGIPLRTFLNRLDALGIARARKPKA